MTSTNRVVTQATNRVVDDEKKLRRYPIPLFGRKSQKIFTISMFTMSIVRT